MIASIAVKSRIPKQKKIQPNTLLEHLYTYYSLSQLQAILNSEPENVLLQKWKTTDRALRADIIVAIYFIKND